MNKANTTSMQEQIEEILKDFDERFPIISDWNNDIRREIRDFFIESSNTIASKSAEVERNSWINQKANDHDERIRKAEHKSIMSKIAVSLDISKPMYADDVLSRLEWIFQDKLTQEKD